MYDVIIIGAGSAGLPAGMYSSRYKLKNLIIGSMPGGALATSHCVENYPGTLSDSGSNIMNNFLQQAKESGSEFLQTNVTKIEKQNNIFLITTEGGEEYKAKKVIYATGNTYKTLNVPGEDTFYGQGVSYCATCDGMFFKNLDVGVVGGGNTAFTEALYLSEIAKHVHLFVRGKKAKCETIWLEKVNNTKNITIHYEVEIEYINGSVMNGVEGVTFKTGQRVDLQGLFIAIGSNPKVDLVKDLVDLDSDGTIIVDKRQETSLKGLYAAGDVTTNSNKFRQTIMSAAEGCLAANSIHEDLLEEK